MRLRGQQPNTGLTLITLVVVVGIAATLLVAGYLLLVSLR
jgi:Tfp pilus assembly protein PilE